MCSEIVGWVRNSASAAREKLPSSATFAKISRRRRSIRTARSRRRSSVAAAAAAAAPAAAARHRGGLVRAGGLEAEDRELAHHLLAGAGRTRDGGRRARNVLLEVLLALLTAVLVDRHAIPRRAARSS